MTLASPLGLVATALFAEYTGITVWFLIGGIVTLVCGGLTLALPALAEAGAEVVREEGYEYAVSASLEENVWFPTKQYTDFALPQGSYTALRVVIGEGGGRNWWCVVFPPLCLGSVTETTEETAALGDLSESDVALMTGEDEGYGVKFKAIELWEDFKGWAEGR